VTVTLVEGGWVVGFDGSGHELLLDGMVAYEDDRIAYVGHDYAGPVDRRLDARGRLIAPGFINTHIHARSNAPHALFLDRTKTDYFGQNFLSYAASLPSTSGAYASEVGIDGKYGMWAALRGGATTVLDVGTWPRDADGFAEMVGELGVRAYVGPGYRSSAYVFDGRGRIHQDVDEAEGMRGLAQAVSFLERWDGAYDGRVRGMLNPGQLDTCSDALLTATTAAARDHRAIIQLHAAMNLVEFHSVLREHGETPIEHLDRIGFLGPEVILGHCLFHAHHSWAKYPYIDDLEVLAASGTSVAHSPNKYLKLGILLESFDEYRRRGVNIALGTDTVPEDLVLEMRLASLGSRIAEGSFLAGSARDMFDAATLGGARALGRDDLGRLAPGAKADLLVIDLRQAHFGAVRDPIASLVECGSSQDIITIIVDGQTLVENGAAVRFDEGTFLAGVQDAGERYWSSVKHLRGATVDEIAPISYPVRASSTGPA